MLIKNRLPSLQQTLAVYGIIALMIYGWTLIWFFWQLPSWKFFLNIGEIGTVLAYSMATNLLESLIVLLIPLVLSFTLPGAWFRDVFHSRGSLFVALGLAYMMYLSLHINLKDDAYPRELVRFAPVIGVLILLLTYADGRIPLLRRFFESLADRATIFSYIFLPMGVLSLLIVIVRNVF